MKQYFEDLDRFEVYNINDRLLRVFDEEDEAIQWAMAHSNEADHIEQSSADTADFERVWTNNGEDYAQCWGCDEWFEKDELLRTSPDKSEYLCPRCFDAYRSHGEPLEVFYGYDDNF